MTPDNDTDAQNRMAQRFDDGKTEFDGDLPPMGIESVKKEWTLASFYLPDTLHQRLNTRYRDLRYESGDRLQKGRHYHPLIVELGLERIERMDINEVKEALEDMEISEQD